MKKKPTSVIFKGTQEQEAKLNALMEKYKGIKGNLMPVLQGAQDIYGYLPIEVQKLVSDGMNVPLAEIYGVATFYSQFALNPKGTVAVSVCLGTACYVKGSGKIYDRIIELIGVKAGDVSPDGYYSFDATRCVGACGLAPVMIVNGEVYGRITVADVKGILDKYKRAE